MSYKIRTMTSFVDGFAIEFSGDDDYKGNGLTMTRVLFIPNDEYGEMVDDLLSMANELLEASLDDFEEEPNAIDALAALKPRKLDE